MFIFTKKKNLKHNQKPLDIYFSSLEEAYGNLPVPSDDWAGIKQELLKSYTTERKVDEKIVELGNAIDVIREHYLDVAEVLDKPTIYG